ncbi:precorrin-3B C(17)-methyltransferase [Phyllobacterium zundukense]|uniref:Precorrin-3B C(17)-methyltransferase n=1 Tax=Phyllobacterium zundukense TaxID=1867719 RepID=A0A2N9W0H3_9HYPH|nr:precorrin-3B C(17)-methyltransferase [Phyllobacterium zundukense]ATU90521.1 precorrin-3B C(17)-methyltransferase [Phyllobacterium zundukense]PIO45241.1 precorrin-3B C(17)-methyltransferase [Phyllobacterium zundukense]
MTALLVLSALGMETALRIKATLTDATIYGLEGRVEGADVSFSNFGETIRQHYQGGNAIIALCAAGITIRSLAAVLDNKGAEPPVLAVADDGSAVVPLLGGTTGVNVLARQIAQILDVTPAITTSGELRFGTCLLIPPPEFILKNPEDGKTFIADLLAGKTVRIEGDAPWLREARLPLDDNGELLIRVTSSDVTPRRGELIFQPNTTIDIAAPKDMTLAGHKRGRLAVVGLGPGDPDFMVPAVKQELQRAEDILGYETYVRMGGPFRPDQTVHMTDNREEMQRARHAFELAATGRSVVMISSGDPGVFAMAAAVVEALHESDDPAWHGVELEILPGVSAALAAASRSGAPLGHDFCILSLSDNLKPWDIIEKRIMLAAEADFAMAFYNPISKQRPWQLPRAIEILRQYRSPETPIVLGRDIGRPAEAIRVIILAELTPEQVDMRTVIIVGSSLTRSFDRADGGKWVYTPRWYGTKPQA